MGRGAFGALRGEKSFTLFSVKKNIPPPPQKKKVQNIFDYLSAIILIYRLKCVPGNFRCCHISML